MKLKMIYTGNPQETKIVNAETGDSIENIVAVSLEVDAYGCNAILHVREMQLDINNAEGIVAYNG